MIGMELGMDNIDGVGVVDMGWMGVLGGRGIGMELKMWIGVRL